MGLLCVALATAGTASAGAGAISITNVGIASGQTLTGLITWTAQTSGTVDHVSFSIDGSVRYADQTAPFTFNGDGGKLDTTSLSNGPHVFAIAAYSNPGKGQVVTASVTATVSNATATVSAPPPPPSATSPTSSSAPVISGSAVVGQTLTASSGTWSGTTPMTYAYQWRQCDSTGATCTAITGATSSAYQLTSAQAGATVRVQVTATNSAGSASSQSTQTPVVSGATTSVTATTFDSVTAYLDAPTPDLANALTVSSASAFSTAIANARAGDTINVLGNVLIPGEFTGFNRVISGGTVNVVFQPGAGFTGMAGSNLPAVWINGAGGWHIWGGTITNPAGSGILVYGMPGPVTWTGFKVYDTGNTCVSVFPTSGNINGLTLKGVAGTATPDLSLDTHAEKGTGIHAWNIADGGSTSGVVENSTFATDVVDQATGAAVEIDTGHVGPNVTVFARAYHLGFAIPGTTWNGYATQQTAGNVIQLWGETLAGTLDIKYEEGNDIQGRMLETSGMYSGASLANAWIDYGVATGPILQSPLISKIAYDARDGIHLGNVSPLP